MADNLIENKREMLKRVEKKQITVGGRRLSQKQTLPLAGAAVPSCQAGDPH